MFNDRSIRRRVSRIRVYISYSHDVNDIKYSNVYIVTVPTPIDEHKKPDLTPLMKASEMLGAVVSKGHVNISGFLNMLVAARDENVKSFTYAASSSTYGDHPALPKVEENIGYPLSPYAVTKYVNKLYADVFARGYDFQTIGLCYFNVFGKRQDPNGAYASVIP